jgi:hypothetical protein
MRQDGAKMRHHPSFMRHVACRQGGQARNAGPMTWQPPPMVRPPADRLRIAGRRSVTAGGESTRDWE